MSRKYDKRGKAKTLELITPLRRQGYSAAAIEQMTGVAASYALRLFKDLGIPKGGACPHCGRDMRASLLSNQTAGEVRPNES